MNGAAGASDQASVTVTVRVNPDKAFLLFTRDINPWWRRGPRFRNAPGGKGIICVERKLGGRQVWGPPNRLAALLQSVKSDIGRNGFRPLLE